ncbi:tRNA-dihydrouridine synthase [Candidatus Vecturithrix granuli]|uniref:tRNA-dihydrouridine synthase n=1 Tax=Vecturithrix granuli TaxID=1499967 RepID=A0A081BUF9_VECG1|nr:tRNA-dihydrouridine synthase [Candidatus Vecturithrix granuli]
MPGITLRPGREIFTDRLRASFFISLVSFLEAYLNQVCKDVAIVVRSPLKSSEIKGNMLERSQKFLEVFGNFTRPSKEDWEFIGRIYDVRNAFVHVNGSIDDYRDARRLRQFIEQQPGLSGTSYLELKKEFCFSCLEKIDAFLEMICSEVRNLCERIKRFESKK